MICLTGDLHHSSLGTGNQKHADVSELQTAHQCLRLLENAGVKMTFYISGKCFAEQWEDVRPLCESPLIQIGGHNYDCFEHELWHRVWNKLVNSYNGPRWYQRRDAVKTIQVIQRTSGIRIRLWRNHMYMHGPYTENILRDCGIKVCSDGVSRTADGMYRHPSGIWNFPLNVLPDHEHLYHAERTPEWVQWWQKRYNWSDDYGPDSFYIDEWVEHVLSELKDHEEKNILSHMIIHPITMYLCDNFKGFSRILDYLSSRETVHVTEVLSRAERIDKDA